MAEIAPVPSGFNGANSPGGTHVTADWPAGQAGDLLLVILSTQDPQVTWPVGWTQHFEHTGGTGSMVARTAFRFADTADAIPGIAIGSSSSSIPIGSTVIRIANVGREEADGIGGWSVYWNVGTTGNIRTPNPGDTAFGPRGTFPNIRVFWGGAFVIHTGRRTKTGSPDNCPYQRGTNGTTNAYIERASDTPPSNPASGASNGWDPDSFSLSGNDRTIALSLAVLSTYPVDPSFTWEQEQGQLNVRFTDQSAYGPTSWSWDFGDGSPTVQGVRNPIHTFPGPGVYTVTLTAWNAANDEPYPTYTDTQVEVLSPPPLAAWEYTNTPGSYLVRFWDRSLRVESWLWEIWHTYLINGDFSDGLNGWTITHGTPTLLEGVAPGGRNAVEVSGHPDQTDGQQIVQEVSGIVAGKTYQFTYDHVIPTPYQVTESWVHWYDETGQSISADVFDDDVGPTWQIYSHLVVAPAGAVSAVIRLRGQAQGYTGRYANLTFRAESADATYTVANPEHVFPGAGPALVRLTATNSEGSDVYERVIDVTLGALHPVRPDGLDVGIELLLDGEWTDLYCDVLAASWVWGATAPAGVFTQARSSTLDLRVLDEDRDLDPNNPFSPYRGASGPGGYLRITLQGLIVYEGRIESVSHDTVRASITAIDIIGRLSAVDADQYGPLGLAAQNASERIHTVLDIIGWPTSSRLIDTDTTPLAAKDISDASLWTVLQDTAFNALGRMSVSQDGRFIYQNRGNAWVDQAPAVVLGCPPDADRDFMDLVTVGNLESVRNLVSAALRPAEGEDPVPVVVQDDASIESHGLRTLVQHELDLADWSARDDWADFVLQHHREPVYGVDQATVQPDATTTLKLGGSIMGQVYRVIMTERGPLLDTVGRLSAIGWTIDPMMVGARVQFLRDGALSTPPTIAGPPFQPDAFQNDAFQVTGLE